MIALLFAFSETASAGEWWENIRFNGDLRYRHELIDAEGKPDRSRHRIRARLGMYGKVNENMTVGIQLATGSDNPVSTNQTIGGGFSSKNVVLDLAYFEAKHDALPGIKLSVVGRRPRKVLSLDGRVLSFEGSVLILRGHLPGTEEHTKARDMVSRASSLSSDRTISPAAS